MRLSDLRLGFSVTKPKGIHHNVAALVALDTVVMLVTEVVHIPGAPMFGLAYTAPSYSVRLPLEVRTSAIRQYLFAIFMLVGGGLGTLVVAVIILLLASHPLANVTWIFVVGAFPFGLFLAVFGLSTAWNCLKDAMRPDPVLIVRENGIEDRCAAAVVPWSAVAQARIVYARGSLNHVRLKLRTPISARQNPFRFGQWHSRPDVLCVPLVLLDLKPHALAQVVAILVKAYGGEVTARGGPMLPI